MKSPSIGRRTVLRGAGASLALPWLEAMAPRGRAHAATTPAPKRLLFFFSPNGYIRDAWLPKGTETVFELGRSLLPLADFKDDLVVVSGVDNVVAGRGPGDDHQRGMGSMLTGTELLPGTVMGGGGTPAGLAGGISVDQELIRRLGTPTRFRSLELGVMSGSGGTVWGYSNYKGPAQPLPPENNPQKVYNRIFAEVSQTAGDDSLAVRGRMHRQAVMDAVLKNFKLLDGKLGVEDRKRLEQHAEAVSELGKQVARTGTAQVAKSCARPVAPEPIDLKLGASFPAIGKMQMDLAVMALKCDLTRVATIQWTHSVGNNRFTWLDITDKGHHDLSHDPDTNLDSREKLTKIDTWYAEQFAYLVGKLKATPDDAGGSLLDNTLVVWCNELSRGNAHSHPDMPFVLAGRAGGRLRTGRFLSYDKVPHNNLLVSILNLCGLEATTFGNPAHCTGPLSGL
jgi:hypothetical protein